MANLEALCGIVPPESMFCAFLQMNNFGQQQSIACMFHLLPLLPSCPFIPLFALLSVRRAGITPVNSHAD